MSRGGAIPPPLVDSSKCNGCSLVGICLPDETNLLRRLAGEDLDAAVEAKTESPSLVADGSEDLDGPLEVDPWGLAGAAGADARSENGDEQAGAELRRLHLARDDKLPVYVQEQGTRIGLAGERLVITSRAGGQTEARLSNTSQVALLGNLQISTQAMRALLERGIPLCLMTYGGYYLGRATGLESRNVELRVAQHRAAADEVFCLSFARGVVVSKIKNARTMLRRNHAAPEDVCDPKRLRKIFKAMRGYGDWLQLSVWQCELSRRELVELRRDLGQIIDPRVDQVLIIDIGPANGRGLSAIASLGRAYVPSERVAVVV